MRFEGEMNQKGPFYIYNSRDQIFVEGERVRREDRESVKREKVSVQKIQMDNNNGGESGG